jgi:Na+/H+ antiporter NhaD/arsenite permease-like protein
MPWYHLLSPAGEKWLTLAVFVVCFALILYRRIPITWVSLGAAAVLVAAGVLSPAAAVLQRVDWNVLAIYWGYGMLAFAFRDSGLPAFIALRVLAHVRQERYALLFLCVLAAVLSSFMANPVVVIMLAPLAIEMAERLRAPLFPYLVGLAISSNVVTTVSMVADPPALILAMATNMTFLDFYWFEGRPGLGTLSVVGVAVALGTLLVQFWGLDRRVSIDEEPGAKSYGPLVLLGASLAAFVLVPLRHPGVIGLGLGLAVLLAGRRGAWPMLREFDWDTLLFLSGIFILVGAVDEVGLLKDLAAWLAGAGLENPTVALLVVTWMSVALSSFIDNVPYTVLMIPVCDSLAQALGVSPWPLYFGMLVGTGIGGNITPVGATANVLACGMLERRGHRIDLGAYMRISVPFSVAAVLVVHLLLQVLWL